MDQPSRDYLRAKVQAYVVETLRQHQVSQGVQDPLIDPASLLVIAITSALATAVEFLVQHCLSKLYPSARVKAARQPGPVQWLAIRWAVRYGCHYGAANEPGFAGLFGSWREFHRQYADFLGNGIVELAGQMSDQQITGLSAAG